MDWNNYILSCATILCLLLHSYNGHGHQLVCENRFPEGHIGSKTLGDGTFRLTVIGPHASKGQYVPNEVYTVTLSGLKTRYITQKFTEFLLVAESEKQTMMGQTGLITSGIFHIIDDTLTRFSDLCPDGVTSINPQPKSDVSVLWTAPSKLVASCVTFKATVVERPHEWFMDDGELSKTLCPYDTPTPPPTTTTTTATTSAQPIDIFTFIPKTNTSAVVVASTPAQPAGGSCCPCDEAKYEVTFEGIWSRETHPKDFPENEWLLHFSDIIGASHSQDYYFWEVGKVASEGIRHVAEWGSTRQLEKELKAKSKYINTIIKARGLWHPNEKGTTSAAFRVDRNRHLMSLVTMIGPSPDWFVGLTGIDLCTADCTWADEANFDLFPFDAGTDSGVTYMSPNTPTDPRGAIQALTESYPNDTSSPFYDPDGVKMKPLAKARIRRQRIYPKRCDEIEHNSETSHEIIVTENSEDASRPECSVTDWTNWSDCSVTCGKGLRMRKRSYNNTMKATMMDCDRQLVETEMCLAAVHTCGDGGAPETVEETDPICVVTKWTEWTPCSVKCGIGVQTRSRRYKNHMGRKKCTLEMSQTRACNGTAQRCDERALKRNESDGECRFTPWSEWTPCNASCGDGFRTRARFHILLNDDDIVPPKCYRREVTQVAPCRGEYGDCNLGIAEAKELCMLPADTGPCRASKQRFYFNFEKGMCIPFVYGGCKGNRNRFDTISECNVLCGFLSGSSNANPALAIQHTQQVSREDNQMVNLKPETSKQMPLKTMPHIPDSTSDISTSTSSTTTTNLPISMKEIKPSATTTATTTTTLSTTSTTPRPPDVNCVISDWSNWTPCSVSCGLGHQVRNRSILVESQGRGKSCPRRLTKQRSCKMPAC